MANVLRVSVLLDWQNVFERGRAAFPYERGQPDPLKVAQFLARDRELADGQKADLTSVTVFFGVASPERDPKTHGARQRQMQHWRSLTDRIHLVSRPLRYGDGMPVEKGIDVAVAIELVRCAVFAPDCDVAILFSVDTDLLPALELVVKERGADVVEVAAWHAPGANPPLRVPGIARIRQHRLGANVYRACLDTRDYNLGL